MSALLIKNKVQGLMFPLVGLMVFLFFWGLVAKQVTTSLGSLPGPVATAQQFMGLVHEHEAEQVKRSAFYERQEKRNRNNFV